MLFPRFLFPGLLTSLAFGCSAPAASTSHYPQNPAISDAQGHPRDSTTFYFPAADFLHATYIPSNQRPDEYDLDERVMNCALQLEFASYALTYFEAPVLSNYYLGSDTYRFLWLRSFNRPVLITLQQIANGAFLRTQVLDKLPMPAATISHIDFPAPERLTTAPKSLQRQPHLQAPRKADSESQKFLAENKKPPIQVRQEETSLLISAKQWQRFHQLLNQSRFQSLAACQPVSILDGAYWLLEAHQADNYHLVFRHSPNETDGFRKACEYLIELSSLRKEERY